jgi:cobalt-zinc-cadmium efflux system membrane fusion protein
VNGRVAKVIAQPGERVKKGAPLVTLTSPDAGNALSDLVKAQAEMEAARHEFERQKELFAAHAGPRKDFEAAEEALHKAQAELERSKQKAHLLSGSIDKVTQEFTLRAPIDGEVIARNVNLGMDVQGQYSGGTAPELFTIGELDRVWVLADVHEVDLPRVQVGADVEISLVAYPNDVFRGKVSWISGVLDPSTRTARIRCELPNPDRKLKPEMFATIRVMAPTVTRLAIPRSALLRLGDRNFVFVAKGEGPNGMLRFVRRPVTIEGDDGADLVPITRGLQEGDQVVTQGSILLSEMV